MKKVAFCLSQPCGSMGAMDETLLDIAGAARFALDSVHAGGGPVCPFELLDAWGVHWCRYRGLSMNRGGLVCIDERKSEAGQRWDAAHELGHIIAAHAGLNSHSERIANGIASGILMPDGAWKRDLGRTGWHMVELAERYGVSLEVATRRTTEVRAAVVSSWQGTQLARRWRSPWLQGRGFSRRRVPAWERALAQDCARDVYHLTEGEARAWWAPHGVWVVTPAEGWESLSLAAV